MNPIGCIAVMIVAVALLCAAGCVQPGAPTGTPVTTGTPPPTSAQTVLPTTVPATPQPSSPPGPGYVPFVPGGEYHVGDRIRLYGTTILSPGNQLLIQVSPLAFNPTNKTEPGSVSGVSAVVTVMKGSVDSVNTWDYIIDTGGFAPGEYAILISGIQVPSFYQSEYFTLLART